MEGYQSILKSQVREVKDHRIILDFLRAGQGEVIAISNTSYCTWFIFQAK